MTRRSLLLTAALALGAGPLAGQTIDNDESLRRLRVDKFILPEFPERLRQEGHAKGIVTVAIGRDGEGRVTDVFVLASTHPLLTQTVVSAVQKWKFARPGDLALPGKEIVPIVRFLFGARGLAAQEPAVDENAPILLPSFSDLDEMPKPLNHPMPHIRGNSTAPEEGGTATVRYFVDETGKVRVPVVIDCTAPEFGRAAIAAVEQWTFEPPRIAGQPTICREMELFKFAKP